MTENKNTSLTRLVYNGEVIHDRGEMLNLTDMWRSKGSPENREPFNWARKEGASFIEAVSVAHNLPDSQVMTKKRGKSGGTWAHWQVGLAYAKYLDHDLHMWVNTAAREKMERRRALPDHVSIAALDDDVRSAIGGIVKDCTRVVIREEISALVAQAVQEAHNTEVHPTVDFSGTVTAADMLDMIGIKPGLRGSTAMITRSMKKFTKNAGCWRTPVHINRSRQWRFPRERAQEWLYGAPLGAELVRSYVTKRLEKKSAPANRESQVVIPFTARAS